MKRIIIIVLILLNFFPQFAFTQSNDGNKKKTFEIYGKLDVFKGKYTDAKITLFRNNVIVEDNIVKSSGRFQHKLELNYNYVLQFSKRGYITKKVYISTYVPKEVTKKDDHFPGLKFNTTLYPKIKGVDYSIFDEPIAAIMYDKSIDDFDYDNSIDSEKKQKIEEIENLLKKSFNNTIAATIAVSYPEKRTASTISKKTSEPDEYKKLIDIGDQHFIKYEWEKALVFYEKAVELNKKVTYPKVQIKKINDRLKSIAKSFSKDQDYLLYIQKADIQFEAKNWLLSREFYEKSLEHEPNSPYPLNQLKMINQQIEHTEKTVEKKENEESKQITQVDLLAESAKSAPTPIPKDVPVLVIKPTEKVIPTHKPKVNISINNTIPREEPKENIELASVKSEIVSQPKTSPTSIPKDVPVTITKPTEKVIPTHKPKVNISINNTIPREEPKEYQNFTTNNIKKNNFYSSILHTGAKNKLYYSSKPFANNTEAKKVFVEKNFNKAQELNRYFSSKPFANNTEAKKVFVEKNFNKAQELNRYFSSKPFANNTEAKKVFVEKNFNKAQESNRYFSKKDFTVAQKEIVYYKEKSYPRTKKEQLYSPKSFNKKKREKMYNLKNSFEKNFEKRYTAFKSFTAIKEDEYNKYIKQANQAVENNNIKLARYYYNKALQENPSDVYAQKQILQIQENYKISILNRRVKKFENLIKKGEDLKKNKQYTNAKFYYIKARQLEINNSLAESKIFEIDRIIGQIQQNNITTKVNSYLELGRKAENGSKYGIAKHYYQLAWELEPTSTVLLNKIGELHKSIEGKN